MNGLASFPSRRSFLAGAGAAGLGLITGCRSEAQAPADSAREVVSVRDFGAEPRPGRDNTQAIQRAVDELGARGGGVVLIPEGFYECGNIVVSNDGVVIQGRGAWLVNGRVTVRNERQGCGIDGLGIVDRRGSDATFLLDIGGRHCTFNNVSLVKDPIAGGYMMYLGMPSSHCTFTGLKMRGSNGSMVGGHDHLFENFELQSTMSTRVGGDDAFAIKGLGGQTSNITIRNGTVRGYSAIVSIGSEVGTEARDSDYSAFVRNVTVSDVSAEGCASLVYIKPGALIYDWRNGLVENVQLSNLSLEDLTGFKFSSGVMLTAGRGAIIRGVRGRNLRIRARSRSQDVLATAAIDINIIRDGAPARIEDVDLELAFADPYDGVPNGPSTPGFPTDHVVRIEKVDPAHGSMANISLDVTGRGTRRGGIYVGAGLDDAIRVRRAHLSRLAVTPPSSTGGGGIWSDSRIRLEDVRLEEVLNYDLYAGRGLPRR